MSEIIDNQVVQLEFDNSQFQQGIEDSLESIRELESGLKFEGGTDGLKDVAKAAKNVDMSSISDQLDQIIDRFGVLGERVHEIKKKIVMEAERMVKGITIQPLIDGFKEYETQMDSVQTILANTSKYHTTLDEVNASLRELNTYADKTIYNFTQMTKNIGTFTAAGLDLQTSTKAIQGIANLAAVSGSSAQQASTAMYQLSQALAAGKVSLQDWNSVVNANMGGQVFQDALKRTSRALGTGVDEAIKKYGTFRESLSKGGWLTTEVLSETLNQLALDVSTAEKYNEAISDLVSKGYTAEEAKEIADLASTANDAATKVKTFSMLIDTLKEALGSGWTQSWEYIIGDFEEAKDLWTGISDTIGGAIGKISDFQNASLKYWHDTKILNLDTGEEFTGRDSVLEGLKNIAQVIMDIVSSAAEGFSNLFGIMSNGERGFGDVLLDMSYGFKNLTENIQLTDGQKENIKELFSGIASAIKTAIGVISPFVKILGSVFQAISPILPALISMKVASMAFDPMVAGIKNVASATGSLIPLLGGFSKFNVLKTIAVALVPLLGMVASELNKTYNFTGLLSKAAQVISGVLKGVGTILGNLITKVTSMTGLLDKILATGVTGVLVFVTSVTKALNTLLFGEGDFGTRLSNSIKELVKPITDSGIIDKIKNVFSGIKEFVVDHFGGIIDSAKEKLIEFKDILLNTSFGDIADKIGSVLSSIVESGPIQALKEKFESLFSSITGISFESVTNTVSDFFRTIGKNETVSALIGKLKEGIEWLRSLTFGDIVDKVKGLFSDGSLIEDLTATARLAKVKIEEIGSTIFGRLLQFVDDWKSGGFLNAVKNLGSDIVDAIKSIDVSTIFENIKSALSSGISAIMSSDFVTKIREKAIEVFNNIKSTISNLKFSDIVNGIKNAFLGIANSDLFKKVKDTIVEKFEDLTGIDLGALTSSVSNFFKSIKDNEVVTFIIDKIKAVFEWLSNVRIGDIGSKVKGFFSGFDFEGLIEKFSSVRNTITNFFSGILNSVSSFVSSIKQNGLKGTISNFFSGLLDGIVSFDYANLFNTIRTNLAKAISAIASSDLFQSVKEKITNGLTSALEAIRNFKLSDLSPIIKSITDGIANSEIFNNIKTLISDKLKSITGIDLSEITERISNFIEPIKNNEVVSAILSKVHDGLTAIANVRIGEAGTKIKEFISSIQFDGLTDKFTAIKTTATSFFSGIRNSVTSFVSSIKQNGLKGTISNFFSELASGIASFDYSSLFNGIRNNLSKAFSAIVSSDLFQSIKEKIANGLSSALESIRNFKISDVATPIKNAFESVINSGAFNNLKESLGEKFKSITGLDFSSITQSFSNFIEPIKNNKAVSGILTEIHDSLRSISNVKIKDAGDAIKNFFRSNEYVHAFVNDLETAKKSFSDSGIFGTIKANFNKFTSDLANEGLGTAIKNQFESALSGLKSISFSDVIGGITNAFQSIMKSDFLAKIHDTIANFIQDLTGLDIRGIESSIGGFFNNLKESIGQNETLSNVIDGIRQAFEKLSKITFGDVFDEVRSFFSWLIDTVKSVPTSAPFKALSDMVSNIKSGISSIFGDSSNKASRPHQRNVTKADGVATVKIGDAIYGTTSAYGESSGVSRSRASIGYSDSDLTRSADRLDTVSEKASLAQSALTKVGVSSENAEKVISFLIEKFNTVKSAISTAQNAIKPYTEGVSNFVKDNWGDITQGLDAGKMVAVILALTQVRKFIKQLTGSTKQLSGSMSGGITKTAESLSGGLTKITGSISDNIKKLIEGIVNPFKSMGDAVKTIADAEANYKNAQASLVKTQGRAENAKAFKDVILGVVAAFSAFLAGYYVFEKQGIELDTGKLLKMGAVFAGVSAAAVALAIAYTKFASAKTELVNAEAAAKGDSLSGIFAPFTAGLESIGDGIKNVGDGFKRIGNGLAMVGVATALATLVASILVMKKAIESYASMDMQTFASGGLKIVGVIGTLTVAIAAIGQACKSSGVAMLGVAPAITAFIVALGVMFAAIKLYSLVDEGEYISGLIKIVGVFGVLIAAIAGANLATGVSDGSIKKVIASIAEINSMVVALGLMFAMIKLYSFTDTEQYLQSLIKIAGVLGLLIAALYGINVSVKSGDVGKTITSMIGVVISLATVTGSLKTLSKIDSEDLTKAALSLGGVMAVMSLLVKSMNTSSGTGSMIGTMTGITSALVTVTYLIKVLSTMEKDKLTYTTAAIDSVLLSLAALAKGFGSLNKEGASKTMLAFATSMLISVGAVGAVLFALSKYTDTSKAVEGAKGIGLVIAAMSASLLLLTKLSGEDLTCSKMITFAGATAIAAASAGTAIGLLAKLTNTDKAVKAALGISAVIVAVSAAMLMLSKIEGEGGGGDDDEGGGSSWADGVKKAVNLLEFIGIIAGAITGVGALLNIGSVGEHVMSALEKANEFFAKLGAVIGNFIGSALASLITDVGSAVWPADTADRFTEFAGFIAALVEATQEISTQFSLSANLDDGISFEDNSLLTFARGVSKIAESISSLTFDTGNFPSTETFNKVIDFVSGLAEAAQNVGTQFSASGGFAKIGPIAGALFSYEDSSFYTFAKGVAKVSQAMTKLKFATSTTNAEAFETAVTFLERMMAASANITTQTKSTLGAFGFGGQILGAFGGGGFFSSKEDSSLITFAKGVADIIDAVKSLKIDDAKVPSTETINKIVTLITGMTEAASQINAQTKSITGGGLGGTGSFGGVLLGGLFNYFEDNSLETFAKGVNKVVKAFNNIKLDSVKTPNLDAVDKISDFLGKMVAASKDIQTQYKKLTAGGAGLGGFGLIVGGGQGVSDSSLETFAKGLSEVTKVFSGISFDTIKAPSQDVIDGITGYVGAMVEAADGINAQFIAAGGVAVVLPTFIAAGGFFEDKSLSTFAKGMQEASESFMSLGSWQKVTPPSDKVIDGVIEYTSGMVKAASGIDAQFTLAGGFASVGPLFAAYAEFADTSLTTFASGMKEASSAFASLGSWDNVTPPDQEVIDGVVDYTTRMIDAAKEIKTQTKGIGWLSLFGFVGAFEDGSLKTFAQGLGEISNQLSGDNAKKLNEVTISPLAVQRVANCVKYMAIAASEIPDIHDNWWSGNNSLSNFAEEMANAAPYIADAGSKSRSINLSAIRRLASALEACVGVVNQISENDNFSNALYDVSDLSIRIEDLAEAIQPLASGMKDLYEVMDFDVNGEINTDRLEKIPTFLYKLADVSASMKDATPTGDFNTIIDWLNEFKGLKLKVSDFDGVTEALEKLANSGIDSLVADFEDPQSTEKLTNAIEKVVADAVAGVNGDDMDSSISTSGLAGRLADAISGIDGSEISASLSFLLNEAFAKGIDDKEDENKIKPEDLQGLVTVISDAIKLAPQVEITAAVEDLLSEAFASIDTNMLTGAFIEVLNKVVLSDKQRIESSGHIFGVYFARGISTAKINARSAAKDLIKVANKVFDDAGASIKIGLEPDDKSAKDFSKDAQKAVDDEQIDVNVGTSEENINNLVDNIQTELDNHAVDLRLVGDIIGVNQGADAMLLSTGDEFGKRAALSMEEQFRTTSPVINFDTGNPVLFPGDFDAALGVYVYPDEESLDKTKEIIESETETEAAVEAEADEDSIEEARSEIEALGEPGVTVPVKPDIDGLEGAHPWGLIDGGMPKLDFGLDSALEQAKKKLGDSLDGSEIVSKFDEIVSETEAELDGISDALDDFGLASKLENAKADVKVNLTEIGDTVSETGEAIAETVSETEAEIQNAVETAKYYGFDNLWKYLTGDENETSKSIKAYKESFKELDLTEVLSGLDEDTVSAITKLKEDAIDALDDLIEAGKITNATRVYHEGEIEFSIKSAIDKIKDSIPEAEQTAGDFTQGIYTQMSLDIANGSSKVSGDLEESLKSIIKSSFKTTTDEYMEAGYTNLQSGNLANFFSHSVLSAITDGLDLMDADATVTSAIVRVFTEAKEEAEAALKEKYGEDTYTISQLEQEFIEKVVPKIPEEYESIIKSILGSMNVTGHDQQIKRISETFGEDAANMFEDLENGIRGQIRAINASADAEEKAKEIIDAAASAAILELNESKGEGQYSVDEFFTEMISQAGNIIKEADISGDADRTVRSVILNTFKNARDYVKDGFSETEAYTNSQANIISAKIIESSTRYLPQSAKAAADISAVIVKSQEEVRQTLVDEYGETGYTLQQLVSGTIDSLRETLESGDLGEYSDTFEQVINLYDQYLEEYNKVAEASSNTDGGIVSVSQQGVDAMTAYINLQKEVEAELEAIAEAQDEVGEGADSLLTEVFNKYGGMAADAIGEMASNVKDSVSDSGMFDGLIDAFGDLTSGTSDFGTALSGLFGSIETDGSESTDILGNILKITKDLTETTKEADNSGSVFSLATFGLEDFNASFDKLKETISETELKRMRSYTSTELKAIYEEFKKNLKKYSYVMGDSVKDDVEKQTEAVESALQELQRTINDNQVAEDKKKWDRYKLNHKTYVDDEIAFYKEELAKVEPYSSAWQEIWETIYGLNIQDKPNEMYSQLQERISYFEDHLMRDLKPEEELRLIEDTIDAMEEAHYEGTEAYYNAIALRRQKEKEANEQVITDTQEMLDKLSRTEMRDLLPEEELEAWEGALKKVLPDSQAYLDILEKIEEKRKEANAAILTNTQDAMDRQSRLLMRDLEPEEEIAYWEAAIPLIDKTSDTYKSALEKLESARKSLNAARLSRAEEHWTYEKNVLELQLQYAEAVNGTTGSMKSTSLILLEEEKAYWEQIIHTVQYGSTEYKTIMGKISDLQFSIQKEQITAAKEFADELTGTIKENANSIASAYRQEYESIKSTIQNSFDITKAFDFTSNNYHTVTEQWWNEEKQQMEYIEKEVPTTWNDFVENALSYIYNNEQWTKNLKYLEQLHGADDPFYQYLKSLGPTGAKYVELAVEEAMKGGENGYEKMRQVYASHLDFSEEAAKAGAATALAYKTALGEIGSSADEFSQLRNNIRSQLTQLSDDQKQELIDYVNEMEKYGLTIPSTILDGISEFNSEDGAKILKERLGGTFQGAALKLKPIIEQAGIQMSQDLLDAFNSGDYETFVKGAYELLNHGNALNHTNTIPDSVASGITENLDSIKDAATKTIDTYYDALLSSDNTDKLKTAGALLGASVYGNIPSAPQPIYGSVTPSRSASTSTASLDIDYSNGVISSDTTATQANTEATNANTAAKTNNTTATAANTTATTTNTTATTTNTTATTTNTTASSASTSSTSSNTSAVKANTTETTSNTEATSSNTSATNESTASTSSNTSATTSNTSATSSNTSSTTTNTTATKTNTIVTNSNTEATNANTAANNSNADSNSLVVASYSSVSDAAEKVTQDKIALANAVKEQSVNNAEASRTYSNLQAKVERLQTTQMRTFKNKELLNWWRTHINEIKEGTDAYAECANKILELERAVNDDIVTDAEKELSKRKRWQEMSIADEISYWQSILSTAKSGSDAYESILDKIDELKAEQAAEAREAAEEAAAQAAQDAADAAAQAEADAQAAAQAAQDAAEAAEAAAKQAEEEAKAARDQERSQYMSLLRHNANMASAMSYGVGSARAQLDVWLSADLSKISDDEETLWSYQETVASLEQSVNSEIYSELQSELSHMKAIHDMSTEEEIRYWEDRISKLKYGSKEYNEVLNKIDELRAQQQEEQQAAYITDTENAITEEGLIRMKSLSNQEQLAKWQNLLATAALDSKRREEVQKKILELQKAINDERVTDAETALTKLKRQRDVSLSEEITYWRNVAATVKVGSEAYEKAMDKIDEAHWQLQRGLEELNKNFEKNVKSIRDDLNDTISDIWDSYEEAIKSKAESLASAMDLFSYFESQTYETSYTLLDNLNSQVEGFKSYQDNLDKIKRRGATKELMEDLESAGPSNNANLESMLQMTDEQWNEYLNLYKQKRNLANELATEEIDKTEYSDRVNEAVQASQEKLDDLIEEYKEDIEKYGGELGDISITIGTSIIDGIVTGIDNGGDDIVSAATTISQNAIEQFNAVLSIPHEVPGQINAGFAENLLKTSGVATDATQTVAKRIISAAKKTLGINSPSKEFADMSEYCMYGWANGFKDYAYIAKDALGETAEDLIANCETLVEDIRDAMSDIGMQVRMPVVLDEDMLNEDMLEVQEFEDAVSAMMEALKGSISETDLSDDATALFEGFDDETLAIISDLAAELSNIKDIEGSIDSDALKDVIAYMNSIDLDELDSAPTITPVIDMSKVTDKINAIRDTLSGTYQIDADLQTRIKRANETTAANAPSGTASTSMKTLTNDMKAIMSKLGTGSNVSNEINNEFNITSNNPREVANEVARIIQGQIRQKEATWS